MMALRTKLLEALTTQFNNESTSAIARLKDGVAPYTRYVRSERERLENAEANVMVGNFGDEYLLMGEAAAWRNLDHVGGASNPNTLPFIYVTAQETLLGEEIYAAGAYLERIPAHIGSLVTQDAMRWLVAMIIIGGILVATFKLAWLWLLVAALGLIILVSIVRGSLR